MIIITQLIYIIDGQEMFFNQFEEITIPIISKCNGRLTLRIRPEKKSIIESNIDLAYEIHLVEFDSEHDFENFKKDEKRKKSYT